MKRLLSTCFAFVCVIGLRADPAADIRGLAPVSVSAANYRASSPEELRQAVEGAKSAINVDAPAIKPTAEPQHYVFVAGEVAESDLSFEKVTKILAAGLAKKGYVNAADEFGIIREPKKVTLVLRVSYGQGLWRNPTVRTEGLSWADGLVPRAKGNGLHMLGAETVFDSRAGGNDDVMTSVAQNSSAGSVGGVGKPGQNAGGAASSVSALANPSLPPAVGTSTQTEYGSTRDFNLIVVDAFDYQELKTKRHHATRVWSTFVAAPVERKQKFSDVAALLVRNATPFFGETSKGLQVYTDARAEVKVGDIVEVRDEPEKK